MGGGVLGFALPIPAIIPSVNIRWLTPTTYISDSDAIMDIEDAYNKITSLYLGEDGSKIEHLPHDIKVELTDQLAKKSLRKR